MNRFIVHGLLALTALFDVPICALGQSLLSINGNKYTVTQGAQVKLSISEADFEALNGATSIQVTPMDSGKSVHKWRFGIVINKESHQASIHVPLSAPPGDYGLRIEASGRETKSAVIEAAVEQVAFPPGEIPVVLLNGFQSPSFQGSPNNCPESDVSTTFGILPGLLINIQSPWAFFDNCAECPINCSIEDLGSSLENVLNSLAYTDGTPVPMFDVIAHSMGGLIVRSYLSGKVSASEPGVFFPPAIVKIRKAVFISTPQFGSFLAPFAVTSVQATEQSPGSQFFADLSTWNNFGDDLRGTDSLDIVGNAGTDFSAGDSDGAIDITSGVGIFFPAQRVRVVPYCHIDPVVLNQLDYPLSLVSSRPNIVLCDPTSLAIADVTDANDLTWQIIMSFLTDNAGWQTVGTSPMDDPFLSQYLGLCLSVEDSTEIPTLLTSASLYDGTTALMPSGTNLFCNSFVPAGTSSFRAVFPDGTSASSAPFTFSKVGTYSLWVVKPGPIATHVTSDLFGGPGFGVASGSAITIVGSELTDSSGSVNVTANGSPLTVLTASATQVRAELSSNFTGLVKLVISNASGSDAINIFATPASAIPSLALSTSQLQFSYGVGAPPQSQSITISNTGGGALTWAAKPSVSWIKISSSATLLTVTVDPSGLAPSTYTGAISVAAIGAGNSPQIVSIILTVMGSGPSNVVVNAVTNAASGATGAIAPGELVTIYGSGLGPTTGVSFTVNPSTGLVGTTLAGTQVFFGNRPSPILYTSANQVNAIVPFELAGQSSAVLQISYQGATSQGSTLQVASAAPGIFTFAGNGSGQATAATTDGSLNGPSNPVAPGSYVTVYFTGGGQTNPSSTTGSVTGSTLEWLTQNVSVTVGGQPASLSFDGAAPGFVAGVGQFNIELANNTPAGAAEPIVLVVGGISSPSTATLSVAPMAPQSLIATLTGDPQVGQAPLNVTLTAGAAGTATGTINYTFYCNRADDGTNITSGFVAKFDGVTADPESAVCPYTTPGTYTAKVIVERGNGAAQATQTISVTGATLPPPVITSVQPKSISAGPTPQIISIVGTGFQAGLTLTLMPPTGGNQVLSGTQLQNFSSSTFQVSLVLNSAGNWGVVVKNPDGQSASATIAVATQASLSLNFYSWPPVFTVGDAPTSIGLQITSSSSGFSSGTATATTSNGGSWLTVDGHPSDTWMITPSVAPSTSLTLTADPNGLAPGTYAGSIVINAPNSSNTTITVAVTMTVLAKLQITTTSLPPATWGQPYNYTLQATGGSGYSWSLQTGSFLPSNLSLSSAGIIAGTLILGGSSNTYSFTVLVKDMAARSAYANLALSIVPPLTVATSTPQNFQFMVGQNYGPPSGSNSMTFQASGGTPPYNWSATGLPPGLQINPSTGVLVGSPTQYGTFATTITAADSTGRTGSAIFNVSVQPGTPLQITTTTLPSATVGVPYTQVIAATGGSFTGYQWTVTGLPQGLKGFVTSTAGCVSSCYQITGAPTQAGNYTITAHVTDSLATSATANIVLAVNSGSPPAITTTSKLPRVTIGTAYTLTFSVAGGTPPYAWSLLGASPDPGLQLTKTGVLQGMSTIPNDCYGNPGTWIGSVPPFGSFTTSSFQVQVTDSLGQSSNAQYCLTEYYPAPVITGIAPQSVVVNGQSTTMTVNGTNFRPGAYLSGPALMQFPGTFVNGGALSFTMTPSTTAAYSVSGGSGLIEGKSYQLMVEQPYSTFSNEDQSFTIYDPAPTISSVQAVLNGTTQPCTGNLNCQLIVTGSGFVTSSSYQLGSATVGICSNPPTPIPWSTITTCPFSLPSGSYTVTAINQNQPSGVPAEAAGQFTVQ